MTLYLRKQLTVDEVEKITKEEIQEIFDSLSSSYKAKTLKSMHAVADAAFRMAVSKGQVNSNPFVGVMIGRIEEHNPVLLTMEQSKSLLESLSESPTVYLPAIIAIETGMQRSQVLALTWGDIDFANLIISVNKNVIKSKNHKFTDIKQHQNRQVVMSSHLAEIWLLKWSVTI